MRYSSICDTCQLEIRRRLALLVFRDNDPPEAADELAKLRALLARYDEEERALWRLNGRRDAQLARQRRRREKRAT